MAFRMGLTVTLLLIAGPVLAQQIDADRAREAAALIVSNNAIEEYCSDDGPAVPGFSEAETAAACDIIANSEDD